MSNIERWWRVTEDGKVPGGDYWVSDGRSAKQASDDGATVVEYMPADRLAGAVKEHWRATSPNGDDVVVLHTEADAAAHAQWDWTVEGPFVPAEQLAEAVEELRALLHAADVEAQSQFEAPDRLREAILRADAWLTSNGRQ